MKNEPIFLNNEVDSTVASFLNSNAKNFLTMIWKLIERMNYGDDYCGCYFSEHNDYDCNWNTGVMFEYFESKKIVSDEEFKKILRMACDNFVKTNNINLSDLNNHTSLEMKNFYMRLSSRR
jgi:CDI immunity protein